MRKKIFLPFFFSLIAAFLPFHSLFLLKSRALLYRDLSFSFIPQKWLWLKGILEHGAIPLWNFNSVAGMPYYAECNNGPLYPLNLILLFFSKENFLYGMSYFIAAHIGLIYLGSYFLLRTLRISFPSALLLAFAFAWNGLSISSTNLLHILAGQLATPFFFAFWLRYVRNNKIIDLFLSSAFLALPIYGGDPQYTYILAITAPFFYFAQKKDIKLNISYFLSISKKLFLLYFLSILCSSAQLLPTLTLLKSSVRATELSFREIQWMSFHPIRLIESFFPAFFGEYSPKNTLWLQKFLNGPSDIPFLFSTYIGSFFLFLLTIHTYLFSIKKIRVSWLWIGILFISCTLSFGFFSPIHTYDFFVHYFPFWDRFRYPERLIYWVIFALLILQAKMFKRFSLWLHLRNKNHPSFKLYAHMGFLCLLCVFLILLFPTQESVQKSMVYTLFLLGSFSLLTVFYLKSYLKKNLFLYFLLFLYCFDLWNYSNLLSWDEPQWLAEAQTYPHIQKILDDISKRKEENSSGASKRIYSAEQFVANNDLSKFPWLDPPGINSLLGWSNLAGNTPNYFGLDSAIGYFSLQKKEKVDFWNNLSSQDPKRLMDLLGIRYIILNKFSKPTSVEINTEALPYLFFPKKIIPIKETAALSLVKKIDYKTTVLIEHEKALPALFKDENPTPPPLLRILEKTGNTLSVSFTLKENSPPSLLAWNESFDPYWHAKLDNVNLPIYKLNHWAMAAALPSLTAGTYILSFVYKNPSIPIGLSLSIFWLILFIASVSLRITRNTR